MSQKSEKRKINSKELLDIKEGLRKKIETEECFVSDVYLTSKVWEHFKLVKYTGTGKSTGYVRCDKCLGLFKHDSSGTGTSHLNKHLEGCIRKKSAGARSTTSTSVAGTSDIRSFLKQGPGVMKKIRRQMLAGAMAFCAYDMRPFEAVRGRGLAVWTEIAMRIAVKYGILPTKDMMPHPTTVSRHLRIVATRTRDRLVPFYQDLMGRGFCAATTDMWTDDFQKHSYTTVTLQYTDSDWRLVRKVLFTCNFPDDQKKTAENIRNEMIRKFTSLNFDIDAVQDNVTFVTDQGPNIVKALEHPFNRMNCCAHLINTILRTIFTPAVIDEALPTVKKTLATGKALVGFLKHSGLSGRLKTTVHQEVETRWNSRLAMIKSVMDNYSEIADLLNQRPKEAYRLHGFDLAAAAALIEFLEPFKTASDILEADGCTINLVYPEYLTLLNFCKGSSSFSIADDDDISIGDQSRHDILGYLKRIAIKYLEKKFIVTDTHKLATLLTPVAKNTGLHQRPGFYSMTSADRQNLIDKLRNLVVSDNLPDQMELPASQPMTMSDSSTSITSSSVDQPERKKKKNLSPQDRLKFFVEMSQVEPEQEVEVSDEVSQYFQAKLTRADYELDVLQWWRAHRKIYPTLAKIARKILGTPASSAASERVFSAAGYVVQDKRSCLLPDSVDAILFLRSNAEPKDFTVADDDADADSSDEEDQDS